MMVRPMLRARSKTRKRTRTPGGKLKTHYKKRNNVKRKCKICGKPIHGASSRGSKSQKRPSRTMPELCARCMRKEIIAKVRGGA
ncbi:MAG: 50S ribosomal protein L34e [Nanoarchaeota archaeon]|nr:50S ribosomal protein L34e [Nanoarchaeota archaeon]